MTIPGSIALILAWALSLAPGSVAKDRESVASAGKAVLTADRDRFKEGGESLKWEWSKGKDLMIVKGEADKAFMPRFSLDEATLRTKGISLWIYNPEPAADSLVFEILDTKLRTSFTFPFYLKGKGWRACWTSFADMRRCDGSLEIAAFRIVPPARKGRVWIDRITFPVQQVNDRITPDEQMPSNNSEAARWHWCRTLEWSLNGCDLPKPTVLTAAQKRDLELVRKALDAEYREGRAFPKALKAAEETFSRAGIKPLKDGGYTGLPLIAPDEMAPKEDALILSDLEAMLYGFALDAVYNDSAEARQRYFLVWRYALDQGFAAGSGMGTNHHYGYKLRKLFASAWMMRENILAASEKDDIIATIRYWAGIGETWKPYERGRDGVIDSWNTLLLPRAVAAMLPDDECANWRDMTCITRWVEGSLEPSPGTVGGFKEDGTGFHHGGFYPAYTSGAVASLGKYVRVVTGTSLQLGEDSRRLLARALQTMRNYSNLTEWGIGLSGRHPFHGNMSPADIGAFAALALAGDLSGKGDGFDRELAADYLRLNPGKSREGAFFRREGVLPAKAPEGFFVLNTGAAGIFRGGDWMVTLKGYTTDVWGAEIYTADNRYGRYQSYGSAQIFSRPGRGESGYVQEGWDWNRLPGTTSIHLPLERLDSPLKGTTMAKSAEDYAGSCSIGGRSGMFSMKLMERELERFTPDFRARKSVFCFEGGRMVFLGSGISNTNAGFATETTLFQNTPGSGIEVNGMAHADYFTRAIADGPTHLTDGQGNHYFIPSGEVRTGISRQHSANERNRKPTEGDFAWAVIDHGKAPKDASYEYWVLIQPEGKVSEEKPYEVLRQDSSAHIVRDFESGITARSFFEDCSPEGDGFVVSCTAETMVMNRVTVPGQMLVSVCDPGRHLAEKAFSTPAESIPAVKRLLLKGLWEILVPDGRISLSREGGNTLLQISCTDGTPVEFTLRHPAPSGN